jgi:hypothetical protein
MMVIPSLEMDGDKLPHRLLCALARRMQSADQSAMRDPKRKNGTELTQPDSLWGTPPLLEAAPAKEDPVLKFLLKASVLVATASALLAAGGLDAAPTAAAAVKLRPIGSTATFQHSASLCRTR